jgi:two-component system sensor histidine kinase KdpD
MEGIFKGGEHVLVCISPAPSNRKVVSAAVKLSTAFQATLTAIYVRPTDYESLDEEDKRRLQRNLTWAEQNGASITTVIGDDVPTQIAEYVRVSGTTKIVMGRSGARKQHFWSTPPLTEQIILNAPDVDVYIIPDSSVDLIEQRRRPRLTAQMRPTPRDALVTLLLLLSSSAVGLGFTHLDFSEANIITVFILGVLVISVTTVSPLCSAAGSLASVLLFNWLFIEPRFSFHTYQPEYVVTFGIMLVSSIITGTLANRLKENARQSAREAFRAKVLFDTNQLLQKADSPQKVFSITARQIITLLNRDVVIYPLREDGGLGEPMRFNAAQSSEVQWDGEYEAEIAAQVFQQQRSAGLNLEQYPKAGAQYHPICINGHSYGVVAIQFGGRPPEPFEYSVFTSIFGECALALESLRNAEEKERASVVARNEQFRSNLLRSLSHDIRTPLTSISGNASNLLSHYQQFDEETLRQIFNDIYDDCEWLIDLVENLLSISRIDNGRIELRMSTDVVNDVIEEALRHVDRNAAEHNITVRDDGELLLARMDPKLIMQVLINLINNAIKNTQVGSDITIQSKREGQTVVVSVCDNGPGIPDERKPHIFEMFYTGEGKIADGRRGLGLGLALCKSIVEAHGGTIFLRDNVPTGCCFCFTLPEVQINE